jgi:hypothetical protein
VLKAGKVQLFQDSFANYSCLEHTLTDIKDAFPELKTLALSSDNAGISIQISFMTIKLSNIGNYHNNNAILSYLPKLAEKFKLETVTYDFKEPQKGKVIFITAIINCELILFPVLGSC